MLRAHVDFSKKLRDWDGFGICLIDKATSDPLEYFTLDNTHQKILETFFGNDGLRMGIVKLFIDPFHLDYCQHDGEEDFITDFSQYHFNSSPLFHSELCKRITDIVRKWGGSLKIMLTSLCPPAWMTKQKELSARDLDPNKRAEYSRYIVAWVKYLSIELNLPVLCISLHSRGEMWGLWDDSGNSLHSDVLNLYWSPEMVVDFIKLLRKQLDRNGLHHIGITPGETNSWANFYEWGYAEFIKEDPVALSAIGLLTSNSLLSGKNIDFCSAGIDLIRDKRPDIHAWVSSDGLCNLHSESISSLYKLIYRTKVNGIIVNSSIRNNESITLENEKTAFLKPLCKAGQPGMAVCQVACNSLSMYLIGFSSNSTRNPDSFVLINKDNLGWSVPIEIRGSASGKFSVYRSSVSENFIRLGDVMVKEGKITYYAPDNSVSVFFAIP